MANISKEINAILNDSRGEDVRDNFGSALVKIVQGSVASATGDDERKILSYG